MFAAYTRLVLRHRLAALLFLLTAVLAVSAGALRLGIDFSIREFFGSHDPEVTYLDGYHERWNDDDMLVIVADGGERGLLDRAVLDAVDAVIEKIEAVEGVQAVQALTRLPRPNRVAGQFIPVPLLATAPKAGAAPERLAAWRASLLADPQVVPQFLSADGRYGSMLVRLSVDTSDLTAVRPVVHTVREVLADSEIEGVTWLVGGVPAIRSDILDVVVHDQVLFVPISATLMALLLWGLFRSKHGVLIPALSAGVPTLMLLGIMGWTGENFGLLNQVYLVLVPSMAVAETVHLVTRFHEELKRVAGTDEEVDPKLRDEAIVSTMSVLGIPVFLTSFTTVQGFASLYSASMPVLRNFGIYAAVGIFCSYLTMMFIVPLALTLTKTRVFSTQDDARGLLGAALVGAARLTTRHPVACLAATGIVSLLAVWTGSWVTSDWRVTETYNEDHPITQANEIVDSHLGGLLSLEYELIGEPGTFQRPDVLAALATFEEEVAREDAVRATAGPASSVRATSRLLGGPDAVPTDPSLLAHIYQLLASGHVLDFFVSPDRDRARVLVRTVDIGSIAFLELGDRLQGELAEQLAPFGITPHLTGASYVAARGMGQVSSDLVESLFGGSLFILFIIVLLFRSVMNGLLSVVPNLLVLLVGYGAMGVLGWQLEPAPAVVFAVALGLAVDSAIHIVARYNEERGHGKDPDAAIFGAILHSGRAILITSLLLLLGFGVNIFSASPANASFGKLGTLIIALGILANVVVLPAMLKVGSQLFPGRGAAGVPEGPAPTDEAVATPIARAGGER